MGTESSAARPVACGSRVPALRFQTGSRRSLLAMSQHETLKLKWDAEPSTSTESPARIPCTYGCGLSFAGDQRGDLRARAHKLLCFKNPASVAAGAAATAAPSATVAPAVPASAAPSLAPARAAFPSTTLSDLSLARGTPTEAPGRAPSAAAATLSVPIPSSVQATAAATPVLRFPPSSAPSLSELSRDRPDNAAATAAPDRKFVGDAKAPVIGSIGSARTATPPRSLKRPRLLAGYEPPATDVRALFLLTKQTDMLCVWTDGVTVSRDQAGVAD